MNLRIAAVAVALFASGCATTTPAVQTGDRDERRATLQALDDWRLTGRVGVAAGGDGFSGGLSWRQHGEEAEITLRGPTGGAAILIRVEGGAYVVTDGRGRTYAGEDARGFIEQNFGAGSTLPVAEMRYWLVGAPAPGSPYRESLGEGGSLSALEQSGWSVRYERYRTAGKFALPERIEMTSDRTRLRVAVSDWRLGP